MGLFDIQQSPFQHAMRHRHAPIVMNRTISGKSHATTITSIIRLIVKKEKPISHAIFMLSDLDHPGQVARVHMEKKGPTHIVVIRG
jgi:hypothetical protein